MELPIYSCIGGCLSTSRKPSSLDFKLCFHVDCVNIGSFPMGISEYQYLLGSSHHCLFYLGCSRGPNILGS